MFQKDYILRMIEQFVKVIAKVLFNKESKNYGTALEEIQENYLTVFGIDKELILASSAEDIISLLKLRGGAKPEVILMLAEFLKEEANLHKEVNQLQHEEIDKINCKALSLFYEVVLNDSKYQTKEHYEKIDSLIKAAERFCRQPDLMVKTILYFELKGEYDEAENILFELIGLSAAAAAKEGENFYDRLKSRSDEELAKGNFSRDEVEQGLSEFKARLNVN